MGQAMAAPPREASPGGETLAADNYSFVVATPAQLSRYHDLVKMSYGPLGFLNDRADQFMPREGTRCYVLCYLGEVVGSCSLTLVRDRQSIFHNLIPRQADDQGAEMMELNNIILMPDLRGGIGLALILYHATLAAVEDGAGLIVGITRYQTLRHFVEAGAIPVDHEPLHLLGREDLHDFVIYYDIRSTDARIYLRERARRLFDQALTLRDIKERVTSGRRTASAQPCLEGETPGREAQAA